MHTTTATASPSTPTAAPSTRSSSTETRTAPRISPQIVSYSGISQYRAGGVSACGIAALNCVRIVLTKERTEKLKDDDLVQDLLSQNTMEVILLVGCSTSHDISSEYLQEIMSICFRWSSNVHLEIDTDIFRVPLFEKTLDLVASAYGTPKVENFTKMLRWSR